MSFTFLQDELVLALCWTLIHSLWQGLLLAVATAVVMLSTRKANARKRYNILAALFFLFIAVTVFTFCRELQLTETVIAFSQPATLPDLQPVASVSTADAGNAIARNQAWVQNFVAYFNEHAALIVTLWFIIFVAKFLRLSANLVYVQRIRSYKVYEPAPEWKEKMLELMRKVNISGPVRLVESGMIKVPVTLGMLKPVILLPLGLLSHLPSDEIEAILLHELAHIRRRDYFVNLLQSFAETIFFFNPAVLWLSSVIRDERENCCDDLAISVTRSKTNFINALISFQEYRFAQPPNVLAFPGTKNQLLNRVKRIISDKNKTLNAAEKSVLSLGIALFILFSFVAAKSKPAEKQVSKEAVAAGYTRIPAYTRYDRTAAAIHERADTGRPFAKLNPDLTANPAETQKMSLNALARLNADLATISTARPWTGLNPVRGIHPDLAAITARIDAIEAARSTDLFPSDPLLPHTMIGDTLPAFKSISSDITNNDGTRTTTMTVTTKDGKQYRFRKVNDELKELSINGKDIPQAEFKDYEEEIRMIEKAHRKHGEDKRRSREQERVAREQTREEQQRLMEEKRQRISEQRQLEMERKRMIRMDSTQQEQRKAKQNELFRKEKTRDLKMKPDKSVTYNPEMKPGNNFLQPKMVKPLPPVDSIKRHPRKPDGPSPGKLEKIKELQEEDDKRRQAATVVMRSIIDDLAKENITIDMEKSWFALDKNQFLVDGKPMPEKLHKRFRSRYVAPHDGMGWYYGKVQGSSGRGIFLGSKEIMSK